MKDAPATWGAVVVRALTVAVVSFVVLQAKELYDAGMLDTPATSVDAVVVGVAMFLVNAVLKVTKGKQPSLEGSNR
jgi:uncharacterized membrane protein